MTLKVEVYRNLTKNCFSVRQNGRIIFYERTVYLKDVTFVVRPGGRAQVLREKRKNVHAFVKGLLSRPFIISTKSVWYDPYKVAHFMCGSEEIHHARYAILRNGRVFVEDWQTTMWD